MLCVVEGCAHAEQHVPHTTSRLEGPTDAHQQVVVVALASESFKNLAVVCVHYNDIRREAC